MNNRNVILNSTILFVIATILQMTLHEFGHFITAMVLHSKSVAIFHNYVRYDNSALSFNGKLAVAAAGPLVSLFLAILFHIICMLYRRRNTLFLFCLYMSVFGYICFSGYLMVASLFPGGDTGYVFNELKFPLWLVILISVAGAIVAFYILKSMCQFFVEMAPADVITDLKIRRLFVDALIKYPLYIGVVITVLLNLPAPAFLSLLYPLCSPFALMWCYGYLSENKYRVDNANTKFASFNRVQPVLIVLLLAIVVLNRLLVFGFSVH